MIDEQLVRTCRYRSLSSYRQGSLTKAISILLLAAYFPGLPTAYAAIMPTNTPAQMPGQVSAGQSPSAPNAIHHVKFQFNISSTTPSVLAGHHHSFQFADFVEGGKSRTVVPAEMLTPAEYVALHQVLQTGHQTIVLGSEGKVVAGRFKVDQDLAEALQELSVQSSHDDLHSVNMSRTPHSKESSQPIGMKSIIADAALCEEEYISTDGPTTSICGAVIVIGNQHRSNTGKQIVASQR